MEGGTPGAIRYCGVLRPLGAAEEREDPLREAGARSQKEPASGDQRAQF